MKELAEAVDRLASEAGFAGVVLVERDGTVELSRAYGSADRRLGVANTVDTRFGIASGAKGLTALTVVSLIEDGVLDLTTAARSLLGSDELPDRTAVGYLEPEGLRTNVLHLPVLGSGDGGMYSTASDIHRLWRAFFAGRIVSREWVAEMVRPRSEDPAQNMRYGLGLWLHQSGPAVVMEGYDAGVSFRSVHDPAERLTHTVISNTSDGAWPIARLLRDVLIG